MLRAPLVLAYYPSRKYCSAYEEACEAFLDRIKGSDAYDSLKPRCDETTVTLDGVEVERFPAARRQPVRYRTMPTGPLVIYSKTTSDLYYDEDVVADYYKTQCPDGYVVPENPDHEDAIENGIGCSIACK